MLVDSQSYLTSSLSQEGVLPSEVGMIGSTEALCNSCPVTQIRQEGCSSRPLLVGTGEPLRSVSWSHAEYDFSGPPIVFQKPTMNYEWTMNSVREWRGNLVSRVGSVHQKTPSRTRAGGYVVICATVQHSEPINILSHRHTARRSQSWSNNDIDCSCKTLALRQRHPVQSTVVDVYNSFKVNPRILW